jgi:hypothetical protein
MAKIFKITIILLGRHLVLFPTGMKPGVHAHRGLNFGLISQCEFGRFWQTLSSMQSPLMTINLK